MKLNFIKKLKFYLWGFILLLIVFTTPIICSAQLILAGQYTGFNPFVQNPNEEKSFGYCVDSLIINGERIAMNLNSSAFEIDLKSMGFTIGDYLEITLHHHKNCMPKVMQGNYSHTEFRIKYPRGDLGQSAGEAELFMLVEHMAGLVTKMEDRMENMMSNSVNIERLQKDMEKVLKDIEKLKDKQRSFSNGTH